jgi:hypothetical protein
MTQVENAAPCTQSRNGFGGLAWIRLLPTVTTESGDNQSGHYQRHGEVEVAVQERLEVICRTRFACKTSREPGVSDGHRSFS